MGNASYKFNVGHDGKVGRSAARAEATSLYASATPDQIFGQNKKRLIHKLMNPFGLAFRESRDSETHPLTVPIIFGLDVTGSMGHIPHHLIKEGLPQMMGGIIQAGLADPALLFLAIGDHEVDQAPLQVGQFESGDVELDNWLTKTYIEAGGGGNQGESYMLAWFMAAFHTKSDAWDKRNQRGFLFTVGDEPCLPILPASWITKYMGGGSQVDLTSAELLALAKERYHVFHFNMIEGNQGRKSMGGWRQLLGENCIEVPDYTQVPKLVAQIVTSGKSAMTVRSSDGPTATPPEEILT